jgi:DNA repair protein RadC
MPQQLSFSYPSYETSGRPRRRIRDLPAEERPLYRLHQVGAGALATTELLALVLGTADAPGLSVELLTRFHSIHQLARASKTQLMHVHGIGEAQAARLVAVLELCRRLQSPPADERPRITSPAEAARLLTPRLRDLEQEELHVALLDTRNRVLDIRAIYKGSLNSSMVRIAEIFRPAIEAPAAAIVIAHNHPSSDPTPSPEDVTLTRQLVKAGKLLDIGVLDQCAV